MPRRGHASRAPSSGQDAHSHTVLMFTARHKRFLPMPSPMLLCWVGGVISFRVDHALAKNT
eukprot:6073346-Pyramimonas_sp.AAC.1